MKAMVTGSKGFIGKHVVRELRKRGHEVVECDPKVQPGDNGIVKILDDIRTLQPEDLAGVEVVFHLGASSGSLHFNPPTRGTSVNCEGTVNLLDCAKKAGVKKIILSSTGTSYGGTPLPHVENCVLNCPNFYTATKLFDEMAFKLYKEVYGLETVILRYASVYGDGEESKNFPDGTSLANVVSQFIWKMMKGESPELWHTGAQTRDLVFVDDVVYANIFAAESLEHGIYNVGTSVETKFTDVVGLINKVLGTSINYVIKQSANNIVQTAYVDRQLFNIDKLKSKGWIPTVTLEEGIRRIVTDIRSRTNA